MAKLSRKLHKVVGVKGTKLAKPIFARIGLRTNGAAFCGGCGKKIERGENYFMVNYPVCMECVEYD